MLVKSLDEERYLDDLQETFDTLKRHQMKLNPNKCAFGVSSRKFLGFMISQRGIEANPDKIQAILDMEPPKNIKEVQSLTGRVAALNRFVFKATDKRLPFFKILRKAFEWTDECQKAFQDLKVYLTTTSLLSPSILGEDLYLYLAISPHAISSALVREEGKVQKPVYYTSQALKGVEGRYPLMEKLAFTLITASRKLRHYFQAHVIIVMTDHPLKKAMNKLEAAGQLIQWAIELSEFDIRYQPRNAIKAQAIADTLAKETLVKELMDEFDEIQYMPSIDLLEVQQIGGDENWMTPIVSYLKEGKLPQERDEARKLRIKSIRYVLMDEVLYNRGFSQPYLRCLALDEANYVLREIHERACGNHSGARTLIHKVVRAGYYWPTIQADAKAYVKVCDQC